MPISKGSIIKGFKRFLGHDPEADDVIRAHKHFSTEEQIATTLINSQEDVRRKQPAGVNISRDDIVWCYRNILGRDPESDALVETHLNTIDFKQLVLSFLGSPEFRSTRTAGDLVEFGGSLGLPPVLDRLDIDVDATPAELGQCAAKIKAAWEHLGDEKAHYSVLSNDAFLPHNLNASIDSFWASGESEVTQAIRALSQSGSSQLEEKICVEYGCGVGRVTVNLAKWFKFVHAYDISSNHLYHARARASQMGVVNVAFHECSRDFRVAMEPCDFFYSVIVLQHNPPPVILELIRIALKALKPGGIAMFQVPTYIVGYRFSLNEWLATEHALDMQMHCVPQDAVLEIISASGCRLLGLREDGCTGARDQIISNTFFCQQQ